jgi:hypothetical protein
VSGASMSGASGDTQDSHGPPQWERVGVNRGSVKRGLISAEKLFFMCAHWRHETTLISETELLM